LGTKIPSTHIQVKTPPPQTKALDKGKSIASEPAKRLEGRNVSSVMIMGISSLLAPTERPLPLKRYKKLKLLRKNLVKRK